MKNIALDIRYKGTNYHGFQRQPNLKTIQGELERVIFELSGEFSAISGCGRTDAGVHAKIYRANFKSNITVPIERLVTAMNSKLPDDIAVLNAFYVPEDFDSRFSCIKKEYTYDIYNNNIKDPFLMDRTYLYKKELNVEKMKQAAKIFIGTQDFAAVKSEGTPVKSTVRTIYYCDVSKKDDIISIKACADGFLYNMMRTISGTLLYVGLDKLSIEDVLFALKSKNRENAGPTLPPEGLYMSKIFY